MSNAFFEKPILNSPYEYPNCHCELDKEGQPTQKIVDERRRAEFITPIPRPKERKGKASQQEMVFDEGKGLSDQKQQYDVTSSPRPRDPVAQSAFERLASYTGDGAPARVLAASRFQRRATFLLPDGGGRGRCQRCLR